MERWWRKPSIRVMIATLFAGISASVLIAYFHYRNNQYFLQRSVDAEAVKVADAIERRVALYQYGLRGVRGVVLSTIDTSLSRRSFHQYSLSRNIDLEFPGARGFGFVRRVPIADEQQFLERARADDAPDFTIHQFTPNDSDRYVIQYIEPVAHNKTAVGLDVGSEANRRAAALAAMRTGQPVLTAPITLVQAQQHLEQSFLFLLPIYRTATTPMSVRDRESLILGWSYAALIINDVLAGLSLDNAKHHLTLWDVTDHNAKQMFYQSENDGLPLIYTHWSEHQIFGRRWSIGFSVHPAYVSALHLVSFKTVFAIGCLISVLVSLLSGILAINRRQKKESAEQVLTLNATLEQQVVQRTEELAHANRELQRQRGELIAARDQLQMAAEVAELGVWDWNIRTNALHWNERMFEIYDFANAGGETNFERWREFIHPDDAAAARAAMQIALEERSIYAVDFRIVVSNGSIRYVQARGYVVCDIDGKPMHVVGINRDVTDQMELNARLTLAKEQADAASAAKSAFLANMSHEIRTPMNAVLGMLQLVQRTGLDTRQRDYISKAHSAAISLLDLLNDILDYSKIEAGKLDLDVHSFELETLMNNLAAVLSGNQQKKDVEVIFDVAPTLPAILIGDSLRLQQVLINLAGNALKFTEHGHVNVSITEVGRDDDKIHLRVAVSDTGMGISPEQQSRLFDAFTQAEASTTRRFGGTGLGLAISQRLVAMMGSTLQIDSALGRGSCFWFDLTLHIAPQTQSLKSVYRSLANLRVLVVDDNALTCEILVRTMQGLDWVADCVNSGTEAVQKVEQATRGGEPYDVIFMDLRLADIDGITAAIQIRNMSASANQSPRQSPQQPPRIIMITAYGRDELAEIQLGPSPPFVDFLTKPVSTLQLVTVVQRALMETPTSLQEIVEIERPPQLVGLRVLVVEDNAMNRQIANELLSGEGAQVELAEGGLEGVHKVLSAQPSFDVVIMDLQMPDIDGLEATRRIRADTRFRDLPILAMTANVSEADRLQCLAAGMDEHIGKPIDLDELVLSLMAILRDRPTRPALQQFTANAERPVAETEELNSILRRFGGKPALFRTMLIQFRSDAGRMLDELAELVVQSDWLGVDRVLHTLKGNAATMGAQAFSRRIAVLERDIKTTQEAEKMALLGASIIVDCRQQLFTVIDTLEALCSEHDSTGTQADSRTAIAPLAAEQWRFKLTEILVLLEASNLQAIEQVEALAPATPPDQQAQFGRLFAQVQALDFASAIITVQTLLQGK